VISTDFANWTPSTTISQIGLLRFQVAENTSETTGYRRGYPGALNDEGVVACFRCPLCTEQLRAGDLLLVGGMRVSQRGKLIGAGVSTIAQLVDHTGPVTDLTSCTLGKLTAQAKLQVRHRRASWQ
jgi:predicted RecB family nuclease